jgi:hypothetical protein
MVVTLVQCIDRRDRNEVLVAQEGELIAGRDGGRVLSPRMRVIANCNATIVRVCNALGFPATARAR